MDQETLNKVRPRMRLFFIGFGVLFVVLLTGLAKVQLLDFQELKDKQARQNYRRILIPGPRGAIFDRDNRLLVGNRPLFSAVVYLNELRKEFRQEYFSLVRTYRDKGESPDRNDVAVEARRRVVQRYMNSVNRVLGRAEVVDSKEIERHFSRELLLPLPLISDLTPEEYARLIEQLPMDSPIQIVSESARYYPFNDAGAHTLGFVVSTENENLDEGIGGEDLRTFRYKGKVGRTGLEKAFDEQLQGTAGGEIWVVDPSGFQHERIAFKEPVKGQDLITSLDLDLQLAAERAMGDHTGAVVAMDVRTGEVLVMASKPDYDLNDLTPFISFQVDADIRERGAWINRAIQGLYPPGSTFKLVTAIAGETRGLLPPSHSVYCPGYLMVGRRKFPCDVLTGHGEQDLVHAIANSCNVFFYSLGLETGIETLAQTARMMGLDQKTGIELPGESTRTVVPDPDYKRRRELGPWYDGDTANTSIGQGFLLQTPLQMCMMITSIARGETRTRPTLVKVPPGAQRDLGGQPLPLTDAQYAELLAGMRMCTVDGTGRLGQRGLKMQIAGKTGTAQVPINGRQSTLAWFVSYGPVEDPHIATCVMIEGVNPHDDLWGGSTAAPIANAVYKAWEQKHPDLVPQPPDVQPVDMAAQPVEPITD